MDIEGYICIAYSVGSYNVTPYDIYGSWYMHVVRESNSSGMCNYSDPCVT